MADKGVRVGSGSFRIDPRKALEVLSRHQLPKPEMFVDLWLRCAQAGRASRIRIDGPRRGLCVSFDGRRFSREELKDPFANLLSDAGSRGERGRNLAFGLLAALWTGPSSLTVSSGNGEEGARLTLESQERWRLEDAPFLGNALEIEWRADAVPAWRARLANPSEPRQQGSGQPH